MYRLLVLCILLGSCSFIRDRQPIRDPYYPRHNQGPGDSIRYRDFRNGMVGYNSFRNYSVTLIKSESQLKKMSWQESVVHMIGPTDFSVFDLIVAFPGDFQINHIFNGAPTTLGDEWKAYTVILVSCKGSDAKTVDLNCSPDAGGGMVFYWARLDKTADTTMTCGCH